MKQTLAAAFATIIFASTFAASPAIAVSCDRLIATDIKTLRIITVRLKKACENDTLSERCTKAIEAGDKALKASDAVSAMCP